MEDVNNQNQINTVSQPTAETNSPVAPQPTQTNMATDQIESPKGQDLTPKQTAERMVPLSEVLKERNRYKEAQRKLAEATSRQNQPQWENIEELRNHPYVQDLELKQAETELRQGAEEILERFPNIPAPIRKAILKNPRGYVNRTTTDVQNALLDIEDYISEVSEELGADSEAPQPKQFPVAGMNKPVATQGTSMPAEIDKILKKPVDEWTPEEQKKLEDYKSAYLKK